MGLILSIFVVFVSVVELLAVYSNFRRNLQPAESNRDFSPLIRRYEAGLHKERRRILKILEEHRKLEGPNAPVEIPSTSCSRPPPTREDDKSSSRTPSPHPVPKVPRNSVCKDYFHPGGEHKFSGKTHPQTSLCGEDEFSRKMAQSVLNDTQVTITVEKAISFSDEVASSTFADLQSQTFNSKDYWAKRAKWSKGKSLKDSKKRMKFGLSLEELEPDWSRAPSPIFNPTSPEVSSAPLKKSKAVDFQSLQITDLNEQIVAQDYWRRSPSPFRDFLDPEEASGNANKQTPSEDADEPKLVESSDGLKFRPLNERSSTTFEEVESWNPNKETISSDEDKQHPPSFDEDYINALDGLKAAKSDEKKRSFRRKRKSSKQNSLEIETKQNGLSHSEDETQKAACKTLLFTEGSRQLCRAEKQEIVEYTGSDEGPSNKDRNSASNAFWLIFSGEYTKAMNKDWHGQHFCCWQCDESLTGQRYVLREEHPYCVACYESVFANSCEKCSRTIGIDSKDLSYKDKHWHEACFLCASCSDSLVDKQFGSKGDRIYCGRCYDEQFASRCDGCGQIFRAGTKKMEYKTRQWHEKCFCCCVCKTPIGTQSFIPREQEIYCAKCYEEKYATRCIKCNKVITSGGVTYKNEPWHRECFTCTHCNTSLAGARFTSRDDKPYCAECFGELFAKRCTACNKPITGIGGTKFISFEDRHWHNDCFFCASCRTTLVGRGFITDGDDIICPECAKQKLM